MLLAQPIRLTRTALALVIVLITAGLGPVTAVIGFCAMMPCCFDESHSGSALVAYDAGCCTTINCYEGPSRELTVSAKASTAALTAPAILPVALSLDIIPAVQHPFGDTSPPPTTQQRLSALSILLI